jgi:hypothetical protein
MRARAQLRGRVGASLFLALLVGLAGALVLAAAAGARRSEAALPRFLAANQTVDATLEVRTNDPTDDLAEQRRQVAALPEVRQVFRVSGTVGGLVLAGADSTGPADPARWHVLIGMAALDPGGSVGFGRPIVGAGRLPDERRPDEAVVDEELAACPSAWRPAAGHGGWWPTSSASSPARWCRPPRYWRSPPARCWPPTWPPPAPAGWPPGSGQLLSCAPSSRSAPTPVGSGQGKALRGRPRRRGSRLDQSSWSV